MQAHGQIDEKLIWLKFQSGDMQAYSTLYEAYFRQLYRYGMQIVADSNLVKDSTQELFLHLWRSRENLGQPVSTKSYLFESLRRTLLKELARKQYKKQEHLPEDYHFEISLPHEFNLIDLQVTEEKLKHLEKALQKLTKRQRDAIHLKFYGQLSYEEIAEIMELQVPSVYNLISKALDTLYQEMKQGDKAQVFYTLLVLTALQAC